VCVRVCVRACVRVCVCGACVHFFSFYVFYDVLTDKIFYDYSF